MAPGFEIAMVTDDVASAHQTALKAGAKELQPPSKKPWGQVVSYVQDMNGFIVEICSLMNS